ncbi:MAG: carbohydrate porin [Candidatus Omnitrophica bacterium]|nr:carbohydrate porin [Candidatus Omnitrophota bacterium]
MIPKLKYVAASFLIAMLALGNMSMALAGGLESSPSDDLSKQIQALKDQVNNLSSTVNELKSENTSVKARSKEMESEMATMKGLTPGTEISKSMESRVASLEEKVGTIKVSGSLTGILQASQNREKNTSIRGLENRNPDSGTVLNRFGQNSGDQIIGAGSFDLYLESKILDNTRIYANLEANSANEVFQPSQSLPNGNPTFSTHLNSNNIDVLNVLELYVESQFYDKRLTTTVGKIDLTNYFDGNKVAWDEHRQFLAGAFLDNTTFASVVPYNTIGARGSLDIGWGLTFQAAVVSQDDSGQKLFNEMFGIMELDYQTFWFFNKEGNYRAYGYVKDVNTVNARGLLTGKSENALGGGISLDQKITDKATVFYRAGYNDDQLALNQSTQIAPFAAATSSMSGGGQYVGLLPNRPDDVTGVAAAWINPSNPITTWSNGQSVQLLPQRDFNEWILEFYYNYQVAKNFHVSPVLQFLQHPNGDDDENVTAIFGGRAFLEF